MIQDTACNKVYFSEWLAQCHPTIYRTLTTVLTDSAVPYGIIPHTNDIWCRDYMPVQVEKDTFVQFVYAPDYLQHSEEDRATISDTSSICKEMGLTVKESDIVLDGGNIVRCGQKVVMIDKVFDENPQYTVRQLSVKLELLLGSEIIFLPWDEADKCGHADGLLRYIGKNRVLLTNYHQFDKDYTARVCKHLTPHFEVVPPLEHKTTSKNSWAYINWLQTSKVLIVPALGEASDDAAFQQILAYLPEYKGRAVQVAARALVNDGGAFNCATWTVSE